MSIRKECDRFTPGTRRHCICEGVASDLSKEKINAYRERWGMEPLFLTTESEGQEFAETTLVLSDKVKRESKSPHIQQYEKRRPGTKRTSQGCRGCSKKKRKNVVNLAHNFLQAATRFIGDGLKTSSRKEREIRSQACLGCPFLNNLNCDSCGCYLPMKRSMRLEQCPHQLWLQELHNRRPLIDCRRNLMMHILPLKGETWRWNVAQIAKRQDLFNGKRIVSVATNSGDSKRTRGKMATDTHADVAEEFKRHGMRIDEFLVFKNSTRLREVVSFVPMLERVKSTDPNEVTFTCHAKAVTHDPGTIPVEWGETMYQTCLDHWPTIQNALECYSMAGGIRRFGQFKTRGNHRWHYSGTFYWFRHDDIFSHPEWNQLDQTFFGTESWPGRLFPAEQCACIFADSAKDPYKDGHWEKFFRPQLTEWKKARGLE